MEFKSDNPHPAKKWLRAIGFFRGFLLVSFMPMSLGAVIAYWSDQDFSFGILMLTLLAGWFVHIGANLINDYYDHISGTDDINEVHTPYSGGTRVIQEGLLPAKPIKQVGFSAFFAGGVLWILLANLVGYQLLILVALGILAGILYSMRPFWLAYRGLGELVLGIAFGPLLVMASFFTQTGRISVESFIGGTLMGMYSAAIITMNEIPDYSADAKAGKRNLVVRYGPDFGVTLWKILLWGGIVTLLAMITGMVFPPETAVVFILVFPMWFLTNKAHERISNLNTLIALCGSTIKTQLAFWALLCIGFVLAIMRQS